MHHPMRRTWLAAAAAAFASGATALLLGAAAGAAPAPAPAAAIAPRAVTPTLTNGVLFKDTDGMPIQAHGGGVIKVGSTYYWIGENRYDDQTFRAVSAYASTDLVNWSNAGNLLTNASAPELNHCNIERPKVIYNAATGLFVLWMHWENGVNYNEARTAVATAPSVTGPYTYLTSFRPLGHDSRDMTVFADDDAAATGYLVSATNNNADLNVYRLTQDYTGVDALVATLWNGSYREAPALFKRAGTYYLLTSGATYWNPNQQKAATASTVAGPWSALQNVGNSIAHGSQTAFVLPVDPNGSGSNASLYLYLADRWAPAWNAPVNESPYVWLPLTFTAPGAVPALPWSPKLAVDAAAATATPVAAGVGSSAAYHSLRPRHASTKCLDVKGQSTADAAAVDQWACNGGANQHFELFALDDSASAYRIVARNSHKCVAPSPAASVAAGSLVVQIPCDDADQNQRWAFVADAANAGYYAVVHAASGLCLDVAGVSTADGANVDVWTCNAGANQQWAIPDVV
ncbi:glycosyl hydrolase [Zopfochytrium polystomum]|nr:glycosyl hydrolase [Zopfochytrium polystomum]